MRWANRETPSFAGTVRSDGSPAVVETLEALDRDANVVASISKAADGSVSMEVDGSPVGSVASVVAGSGVTVDATDPANPIVSASGGGGGGLWTQATGLMRNIDYSMLSTAQKALLTSLDLNTLGLTDAPILTGLTALTALNLNSNSIATAPDLTGISTLTEFRMVGNTLIVPPDVSAQTDIVTLRLETNQLTSAPDLTGLALLTEVSLAGNALPTAEVNAVLVQLDANGAINGFVDLSGGTNGAPSGAGSTAQTSLEGNGWTVVVN